MNSKLQNNEQILKCIFRNPAISRTEIARLTGITPATTTHTISSLIHAGIVYESGQENDSGSTGRKRISLDIRSGYAYALGLEFNQKALVVCITDLKGTVVYKLHIPYRKDMCSQITVLIIDTIKKALCESGISESMLVGIGIAIPGHLDKNGSFLVSNNNIWKSFRADTIKNSFSVPVVIENNARCMAVSHYLFHPEYTPENFAFFHVGLGMFCANIINGQLFLGHSYVSGEVGHIIVKSDGLRCECGKRGCLQTVASERWLIKNAQQLYQLGSSPILQRLVSSADDIDIQTIISAYTLGDEAITSLISNALNYLGISISNVAILMNSEKIFLHGELFSNPAIHSELIHMINLQLAFVESDYVESFEILPYRSEDGAIGGAALAIFKCFLKTA